MTSGRFEGRVAVITGGGSGIGQAIAVRLAQEGASVQILEPTEQQAAETLEKIESFEGLARAYACDISIASQVSRAARAILVDCERLDVLINNAGIAHIGTVESTTEEDFDRLYRVNVKGAFLCTQAFIGSMASAGRGVILNVASIASYLGISERFAYSTGKGAVLSMTLSVARDYVSKGIRCNAICPARVHTPFVDRYLAKNYPGREAEMFEKLSAYQPIGRMGSPEEIAALAAFLCSDEAGFITGSVYEIDGGSTHLR